MRKPVVVVTGTNGQLGWEIQQLASFFSGFDFLFTDRAMLDLSKPETISVFFAHHKPDFVINCAAYTAVDKAETERDLAYTINVTAVGALASACKEAAAVLIHISTDYVFNGKGADGNGEVPYLPDSVIDPINYYGETKADGERLALSNHSKTIIIRTSWVYSSHGNNFVKTMLRLMKEREELKIVSDQIGSPTYAADLAEAILHIVEAVQNGNRHFGIYQYSNSGIISWYDFAVAIQQNIVSGCSVSPIPTTDYPTPAKRPAFSGMNTDAIVENFGVKMNNWEDSLKQCLQLLV